MRGLFFNSFFSAFLVGCSFTVVNAQPTFYNTYQDAESWEENHSSEVFQLPKGGYFNLGSAYVKKFNNYGDLKNKIDLPMMHKILQDPRHKERLFVLGINSALGDYYMAKINTDGEILNKKYKYVAKASDTIEFAADFLVDTNRKTLVFAGGRSRGDENNPHFWIGITDYDFNFIKQKSWIIKGKNKVYYFRQIVPNQKTGGYVVAVGDYSNNNELWWLDSNLNVVNARKIEVSPCLFSAYFSRLINLNDSIFVIYGSASYTGFDSCSIKTDGSYIFIFNHKGDLIKRQMIYEGLEYIFNSARTNHFLYATLDHIGMMNDKLEKVWEQPIIKRGNSSSWFRFMSVEISQNHGFYYGAAVEELGFSKQRLHLFCFDSIGNINGGSEYSEWQQSLMLLPNPAKDKVRVIIPYYLGMVETRIYDMQGRLMLHKTHNEKEYLDLANFAPGSYIVKSTDLKRGKTRTMKLVVE
jgi:hypothetical protein